MTNMDGSDVGINEIGVGADEMLGIDEGTFVVVGNRVGASVGIGVIDGGGVGKYTEDTVVSSVVLRRRLKF
jgi:hypothetical protein